MRIFNKNNTLIKLITTNKKIEHCLYLVIKIIKVLLMMIIHNWLINKKLINKKLWIKNSNNW